MTRTAATAGATAAAWPPAVVLWLLALAVMAAFQLWRGAVIDGIVFATLTVGLVIERAVRMRRAGVADAAPASAAPPRAPRLALVVAAAVAACLALVLAPRTGPASIALVVALGLAALALAWRGAPETPRRSPRAQHRSRVVWASLGVALCLWEAAAYVLSVTVPRGWIGFPTVSLLLEPVVELDAGRAVLVGAWITVGVWLVAGARRRRW